jgi:hypothetical protein
VISAHRWALPLEAERDCDDGAPKLGWNAGADIRLASPRWACALASSPVPNDSKAAGGRAGAGATNRGAANLDSPGEGAFGVAGAAGKPREARMASWLWASEAG